VARRPLSKRDERILSFVGRYRAATEPLLETLFFRKTKTLSAQRKVTSRLVRRGYLRVFDLAGSGKYFVLTRRGSREVGQSDRTPRRFTEQSLPVALAIAHFCVREGVSRMTDAEFRERFPELAQGGIRSSIYYIAKAGGTFKLGIFIVDRGATPRRIRGKIRRIVSRRRAMPAFVSLLHAGRVRITILTGTDSQAARLTEDFARHDFARLDVEVSLVAELGELLTAR